ncbi:MAG: hypothetical protein WBK55_10465 [Alphaproteobacteria bacterium]
MGLKFNEQSEKPEFLAKPNPLVPHSWQIFQFKNDKGEYEPIGDYVVVDTSEDIEITDKKIANLAAVMNGRKGLIDFTNLTGKRVLFNIIPETSGSNRQKIVFRTYDGAGVSTENAVLTIEKGVFNGN